MGPRHEEALAEAVSVLPLARGPMMAGRRAMIEADHRAMVVLARRAMAMAVSIGKLGKHYEMNLAAAMVIADRVAVAEVALDLDRAAIFAADLLGPMDGDRVGRALEWTGAMGRDGAVMVVLAARGLRAMDRGRMVHDLREMVSDSDDQRGRGTVTDAKDNNGRAIVATVKADRNGHAIDIAAGRNGRVMVVDTVDHNGRAMVMVVADHSGTRAEDRSGHETAGADAAANRGLKMAVDAVARNGRAMVGAVLPRGDVAIKIADQSLHVVSALDPDAVTAWADLARAMDSVRPAVSLPEAADLVLECAANLPSAVQGAVLVPWVAAVLAADNAPVDLGVASAQVDLPVVDLLACSAADLSYSKFLIE